jgi:hypothetical protein
MGRSRRTLRQIVGELRWTPEERRAAAEERCMEALFDAERFPAVLFAERERAALEAERRRWGYPVVRGRR